MGETSRGIDKKLSVNNNLKTVLSGVLSAYISSFSGYNNGKIILAATKMQQAKLCFDDIVKFIGADDDLHECFEVKDYKNEIISNITGTRIIAFGRDAKSIDGHRAILGVCDELHAHPTNQIYKLIQGGQGKLQEALLHAITTAGFDLNSFCKEHYDFCIKILEGVITKDTQFIYISQMDKDDQIWDYRNWVKANPTSLLNHDYTYNMQSIKVLSEIALDAQEKRGQELADFMTKRLNEWYAWSDNGYLDLEKLKACECDLTLNDFQGKDCFVGLDLSQGGDLNSIAFVFPFEEDGVQKYFLHTHSFLPELRLLDMEKSDKAPYRQWVIDGLITTTSGNFGLKVDYKAIIKYIRETKEKYKLNFIKLGYDVANANALLEDLDEVCCCDLEDVRQIAQHLNAATEDFKLSVESGQLLYNKCEDLLKWSAGNAKLCKPNSYGQVKIDKSAREERIDVIDATIDAWKMAIENKDKVDLSKYRTEDYLNSLWGLGGD